MIEAKGSSFSGAADGTSDLFADVVDQTVAIYPVNAAITTKIGTAILSKGTAGAYTIANPTATTDDGKRLKITSTTAAAHVITDATSGFNNKGSSGTLTFGAAIGNSCTLFAYQGKWYVTSKVNVTVA